LNCPIDDEAGKKVKMSRLKEGSDEFSSFEDRFESQFRFFAGCPECGAKLLGYRRN
jgi:hypothetical protein